MPNRRIDENYYHLPAYSNCKPSTRRNHTMNRWMLLPAALLSALILFVIGGFVRNYGLSDAAEPWTGTHWTETVGSIMVYGSLLLVVLTAGLAVLYGLTRFVAWAAR